jgi:hypothetical protein
VEALVQARLVAPLRQYELRRSGFSRARQPPSARRVRLPEGEVARADARGQSFVRFSVDTSGGRLLVFGPDGQVRRSDEEQWRRDEVTGCVYPASGEVYVQRGSSYSPVQVLWGKRTAAVAQVCRLAEVRS